MLNFSDVNHRPKIQSVQCSQYEKLFISTWTLFTPPSSSYFYNIAHGNDDRPVESNRIRKSIGKETTLLEDIDDTDQMLEILENIAERLENSLFKREAKGRTITLKIKYFDFQSVTRSITIDEPADSASVILKYIKPLLAKTQAGEKKVRLLGISISNFDDQETNIGTCEQLLIPFKGFHKICFWRETE